MQRFSGSSAMLANLLALRWTDPPGTEWVAGGRLDSATRNCCAAVELVASVPFPFPVPVPVPVAGIMVP